MIVIADTALINYLVQIQAVDLLHQLYGDTVVPLAVLQELTAEGSPIEMTKWVARPPDWFRVEQPIKSG